MGEVKLKNALVSLIDRIIIEQVVPAAESIKVNLADDTHLLLNLLNASIVEQCRAICVLVSSGLGFHSYPILRSQLECHADLLLTISDPKHSLALSYSELLSLQKQLVSAKGRNPYLSEIAADPNLVENLSRIGLQIKTLEKGGAPKLAPETKMKKAGLDDEYGAIYPHLSDHVHNNPRALASRHLRYHEQGITVVALNHGEEEEFDAALQTSLDLVLRASLAFHSYIGSKHVETFKALIAQYSYEPAPSR